MKVRSPIRKRRASLRRGELTPAQKTAIRQRVFIEQFARCEDCGQPVIWESGYWESMHLHHIRPRSLGGTWERSNLACLCVRCHEKRHH